MKTNINRTLVVKNIITINTIMKQYIKYLCVFLMLLGTSAYSWGNTLYLPSGSSTYTRGAWQSGGAPSAYSTTPTAYNVSVGNSQCLPISFYNAADFGTAYANTGWLQLKGSNKSDKGYITLHVTSTSNVTVTVSYCCNEDATLQMGASSWTFSNSKSDPTASGAFSTISKTGSSDFDLTITAGTSVVYIGTITLSSSNAITTGDCVTLYNITYDNDGNGSVSGPSTAAAGSTVNITLNPNSGYESDETWWYDEDWDNYDALAANVTSFTMPAADITVYAYFKEASCSASPTVGNAANNGALVYSTSPMTVPITCPSIGAGSGCAISDYGFVWKASANPTISDNKTQIGTDNHSTAFSGNISGTFAAGTTYYVKAYAINNGDNTTLSSSAYSFTPRSITFESNGGSAVATILVISGTAASQPTNPTKTGYTFAGWYSNSGLTTPVDWSATIGSNKIYYAKWTANDISITLKKNNSDASGSTDGSASVKYDATALTSVSHATRANYRLEGYYAESACTHKVITDAGVLVNYSGYVESGKWVRSSATDLYANWTAVTYSDYKFSCAELTLTPVLVTSGTPIFITSTASKKVRSQDYIQITGSGLTPSTTLTFPDLPAKFEIKTAMYGALATDASGAIDAAAYIFYTPDAGSTTDGLDEISGITVSVSGAKAKQVSLEQSIIGRHLPADFVIAGKKDGKWYALPSTMASTTHPDPVLIAVDNETTPTTAYTTTDNAYSLYDQTSSVRTAGNGQYVKLAMKGQSDAPLFGMAPSNTEVGKSGTAIVTNDLSAGWWWQFKQINTSISAAADAKYNVYCANNTSSLSIKNDPVQWGLYSSGVEELRLLKLETITPIAASVTEWGKNSAVFDVNPKVGDDLATKVIAYLGDANSGAKDVVETQTSVKGYASKYNYTVNFGSGIDFSAAASEGALLRLEWKKGETLLGSSVLIVPKIIAADANLHDIDGYKTHWESKEVHVLPGKTLTVDAGNFESKSVTIGRLEIYPGATVVITKGSQDAGTLTATNLVLRNGWTRANGKSYGVARLYIDGSASLGLPTNAYADWYIDYDQYYPVAVPWDVTTSSITYLNTSSSPSVGPSGQVRLRYYDGESRASNGQTGVADGANWKEYGASGNTAVPSTLKPGLGYALTAKRPSGKAFSVVRMPLTIPSASWTASGEQGYISPTHKDEVSVTAHGADAEPAKPAYLVGWNFIGNPYMSIYQGELTHSVQGEEIAYVNIPDESFRDYGQYPAETKKLLPASGFFIQTSKTGTLTFGSGNRKASAPAYHNAAQTESVPVQKAYIDLTSETEEDMMGIWVADKYTEAYEMNADLEKLLGDGTSLRTYMRYGDMNMAYVAINETLAKEWIPVLVRIPETGEYTFSLNSASKVSELEGVYLIDYENGDLVTNLLESNYTFFSESGTISGRFAINAVVGNRVPTAIDAVGAGDATKPVKFIYHDQMYILLNGVIYDATGKKVREINK